MNNDNPPKITSSPGANNRTPAALVAPTREQLDSADVRILKTGESDKADLLEVDLGAGPMVVKDFSKKAWWIRVAGRLQIWREARAYRILGPDPGAPRFVGRIDAHALAVEKIDAVQLGYAEDRTESGEDKLRRLREILDRIHAKGLVHWDLRTRENLLVDAEGKLYVLDFASAMWLRPGGLAHRLLFRWFRLVDESAYLKWKRLLEAGSYTEEENAFLDRFRFLRALWIHRSSAWRRNKTRPKS